MNDWNIIWGSKRTWDLTDLELRVDLAIVRFTFIPTVDLRPMTE